jgi:quercetin dioxygenase-like cupin family protein
MKNSSKIIKSSGYTWENVDKKEYKTDTQNFKDIHRYTLLTDENPGLKIETRYFEIQPGGYSSLEQHTHTHSVIIIRGSGSIILDNELQKVAVHDVVYISPETIHQFHADNGEPLGFICVVSSDRDRPKIPNDERIEARIRSEKVLKKIRK